MPIAVLGPVDVGGPSLAPRERAILAALVLRRGSAVSGDELAEAYWIGERPATWWQQVKTSIARIRDTLGADSITTAPGGYLLALDPGVIDAVRFERLVDAARADAARDDAARAIDRFEHALSLWRAAPYPELQGWGPGLLETMRLTEVRASVEEELLSARLDAGESSSIISEAQRLVGNAPLREERWALLALANYRSGRQAEALAVLREARAGLDRELGIAPGARLSELATAMLRQDPTLSGRSGRIAASNECPYRGLAAFGGDNADLYFGREADIEACLPRVQSGRVLAIVGPSGSGKSSLLHAGLLPAVRASGREIVEVPSGSRAGIALRDSGRMMRRDLVVAIDQFEELLALEPDALAEAISGLERLLARGAAVVLTIRSDFLDTATGLPGLGTHIGRGVVAVAPLTAASLREVIERPARLAALHLEPGLVELILRDTGDRATALPHLSHVLVETWLRREGSTLTVDGYDAAGGLAGSIAVSAEQRYQSFSPSEQEACRTIMLRLVEVTDDGAAIRRRLSLSAVSEDPLRRVVVDALVTARLLTIESDTVAVTHESIAHAWPRLTEWLEADAESAHLVRRLESSAALWDDAGRPVDELLRGPRLAATLAWRDETHPILSQVESDYLEEAADDEQARARTVVERARRDRRQNRMLRGLLAVAAGLLVVALVAATIAIVRGQAATQAEGDARIETLAATVQSLLSSDHDAAALLAAELYRQHPHDVRVRSALLAVAAAPGAPVTKVSYPADERIFATPIPGTMTVLVARNRVGTNAGHLVLEVRDMSTGALVRTLGAQLPPALTARWGTLLVNPAATRALLAYSYSPGGNPGDCCSTVLATVELASGKVIAGPTTTDAFSGTSGAFTADGTVAVLGEEGSESPVWVDPVTLAITRSPEPGMEHSPVFDRAADGTILVGTPDRVDRRDPATHALLASVALPGDFGSYSIRGLDDGGFVSAGPAGFLRADAAGGILWTFRTNDCDSLVDRSATGSVLCLGDDVGIISEYRLADGIPTGRTFDVQAQWVTVIDDLADGSIVAFNQRTAASITRFNLDGSGPASHLIASGHLATGFVDDRTIVVARRAADPLNDPPGSQQLWNLARDSATGPPATQITALGGGVVARWTGPESGFELSRPGSSATWHLTSTDGAFVSAGTAFKLMPGATSSRAFAINSNWIVPFDPRTGAASGPRLNVTGSDLLNTWVMVHEVPGRNRAVVSWWNNDESQMVTAVFDLSRGREVARGLYGDVASVGLPNGQIASTSSSELRRSSDALVPIDTLAKPVSGANQFELSTDGSLLLLQGNGQPANLYDVATGLKLGGDIPTDSPGWGSAHLAPDGKTMLTNVAAGVLIWDLNPADQAPAVCHSVGRILTATEWRTFFGDQPQVDTCKLLAS